MASPFDKLLSNRPELLAHLPVTTEDAIDVLMEFGVDLSQPGASTDLAEMARGNRATMSVEIKEAKKNRRIAMMLPMALATLAMRGTLERLLESNALTAWEKLMGESQPEQRRSLPTLIEAYPSAARVIFAYVLLGEAATMELERAIEANSVSHRSGCLGILCLGFSHLA